MPFYGLDAELQARQEARYDQGVEKRVTDWIGTILGESKGDTPAADWLRDGQILCRLANTIRPGSVKKINKGAMVFKQRENITYFQSFARDIGVPEISMFSTDDLFDKKNMGSVIQCIYILGGVVQVVCPN